jgi:hypothetical protein
MNNIVQTTYYSFSDLTNIDKFDHQVCNGYLKLYNKAKEKSNPTILEPGTNKGPSTLVFLQATAENGGRLYSVDIDSKFSDLTAAPGMDIHIFGQHRRRRYPLEASGVKRRYRHIADR